MPGLDVDVVIDLLRQRILESSEAFSSTEMSF